MYMTAFPGVQNSGISICGFKNAQQEDAIESRGIRSHVPLQQGRMCQHTSVRMVQIKALPVSTGWLASDKL